MTQAGKPRTVLLTLGRLPKCLDLARGFHAAGCRVIVAEPFKRHLAGASRSVAGSVQVTPPSESKQRYLEDLEAVIDREAVDLVVPVSEETMHVAFLSAHLGHRTRVFTMSPEHILALYNKRSFIERALAFGVAVPETCALSDPAAVALTVKGPVIVKPMHSCSGRGVRKLARGEALPIDDPADPAVVQTFVRGDVYSSFTLAEAGACRVTVVYRGIQMSGTVAVAFERVEHPAAQAWIEQFVAASGHTGFISFDLIVDGAGKVWGIECNPRATSGLHFLEAEDVAAAILEPDRAVPIRFRSSRVLQQFYSCLTETQASMFRRGFLHNLRRLFSMRDVSWSLTDPMPFLTMTYTSWPIISEALRRGTSFGEVATLDIGWYD